MRVVVAAVVVAALVAGCDDNAPKYSRGEVEQAFESQGFELGPPADPDGPLWLSSRSPPSDSSSYDGAVFGPRKGEPFLILVYDREGDANTAFQALRSSAKSESFEIQRANVVVDSYEGVTAPTRKRIRDALAELG